MSTSGSGGEQGGSTSSGAGEVASDGGASGANTGGGSSAFGGNSGAGGSGASDSNAGNSGGAHSGGADSTDNQSSGARSGGGSNTSSSQSGGSSIAKGDGGGSAEVGEDGGCVPNLQCKPTPPNTGDYYADCVTQVNAFRACVCQPPLASWDAGEACANQDSQYDDTADAAHAGFKAGICTPEGNGECECPGWGSSQQIVSGCLQEMFDEGPPDSGYNHFSIMTNAKASMVACGIYTDSKGKVWAIQNYQ